MDKSDKNRNNSNIFSHYKRDELKERIKELDCLYGLTEIVKDKSLSKKQALQKIIELIPPAWQYPDITCARLTIEGEEYITKNPYIDTFFF